MTIPQWNFQGFVHFFFYSLGQPANQIFLPLTSDLDDGNTVTLIMMILALEQAGEPAHFIMPQMKGRVGEPGTGWDSVMIAMEL